MNTLWEGKWISVVSPVENPYEAVHEKDVIIVVARLADTKKWLVRLELCPPYNIKESDPSPELRWYTTITGKIEEGEEPRNAAIREVEEEAGIKILDYEAFEERKNVPVCKSTDMRCWLYVLNITDYERVEVVGDGTYYEEKSKTVELTRDEIASVIEDWNNWDMLFYMAHQFIVKHDLLEVLSRT